MIQKLKKTADGALPTYMADKIDEIIDLLNEKENPKEVHICPPCTLPHIYYSTLNVGCTNDIHPHYHGVQPCHNNPCYWA